MEREHVKYLQGLEAKGDHIALIKEIRNVIAEDRRAFEDRYIKWWCGRRWRNIFLSEAVHDDEALDAAGRKGLLRKADKRCDRRRIAERFLKGEDRSEWF